MSELFLLRGLPGAGKTTIAQTISKIVFSADDFFYDDKGNYNFVASDIGLAHKLCMENTEKAMKKTEPIIVVANTFSEAWEMEHYFALAQKYLYRVHTLIVENRHNSSSRHAIPDEVIANMKKRFEIIL